MPNAIYAFLVPSDPAAYRDNNINTIRTAMALLVVWSHCFALYLGSEAGEPLSRLLNGHTNAGNVGVRLFFVLSGFLVTQSWFGSRGPADYLRKRVRRIFPGFVVATAFCTFIVVPLFASAGAALITQEAFGWWLFRALTLQETIPAADAFADNPGKAVNGALWSIRYEFWCYIGLGGLGLTRMLRRRHVVAAIFVAVVLVKVWLDLTGRKPGVGAIEAIIGWPYAWFSVLPYFLAGMLGRLYGERVPRSPALLAAGIFALLAAAHGFGSSPILFDALAPLVASYGALYLAFHPTLHLPDAARFGDFSYGIYLYGFPIQQMVKATLPIPFPTYIVLCMILSVLAGVFSWHGVEKWFLRKHKPRLPTPPIRAEAVA